MSDQGGQGNVTSETRAKLFLSYTRADIEQAGKLRTILEDSGFDVWWDQLLEGGTNYLPATEAALEGADCVVVLWSKLSVDSSWVRDEAQRGREKGRLVPLSLDGTISPLGFRQVQLLDIQNWSGKADAPEIAKIVNAIRNQVAGNSGGAAAQLAPQSISSSPHSLSRTGVSRRALMIGGVGLAGGAAALAAWQGNLFSSLDSGGIMSMAVLRFTNLSGEQEQAWFSDGLSNELRQALSRNERLRVSAPTSSNANEEQDDFEIARALGVASILRGSVQLVAETVRIYAELLQVDGGVVLWSETYDREFTDVLAVQSEIAETVALSLVQRVASENAAMESLVAQSGVGSTDNVRAYEAYLRGQYLVEISSGESSDRAALAQFDAAIDLDPNFAAAYAMRANMLAAVANAASDADEVDSLFAASITAAERSIELAPNLAEGHLALGYVRYYGQTDRAGAYQHYKRAEELAPGNADILMSVAVFYAYGNQQALATQIAARVLELDPLNARAFRNAGFIALFADDYAGAINHMEKALDLNPSLASAQYAIGNARFMLGDIAGARDAFTAEEAEIFRLPGLAITLQKLGDAEGAQQAFGKLLADYGETGLYQQAQVHAQWGETDEALTALERAFDEGDPGVLLTTNDPLLDPIRDQPALDRLLLRLSS